MEAQGEVVEGMDEVGAYLMEMFKKTPQRVRYFGVSLDAHGNPDSEAIAREASKRVLILFRPG